MPETETTYTTGIGTTLF